MSFRVTSMIATAYVRDIAVSRAFYELIGFRESASGTADTSAWSYLRHHDRFILLASTTPPLSVPTLPLLFYFFVDDLGAAVDTLDAAGVAVDRAGNPPHARGGEVRIDDPDGNTILLGQAQPLAGQDIPAEQPVHFSLLRAAAAKVAASGGAAAPCEVKTPSGPRCGEPADVRLADPGGHAVWACLPHAEEILIAVPGAFIASADEGLTTFVSHRR